MKSYRCSQCGKLRYGNADEKGSEGIVCWVCTFKKLHKSLNFSQEVDMLSGSLKDFFMKIRATLSGSRKYSLEDAEKIAWEIIKENAVKDKKGKYRKKRGVDFFSYDIKKKIREIEEE